MRVATSLRTEQNVEINSIFFSLLLCNRNIEKLFDSIRDVDRGKLLFVCSPKRL